MKSKDAILRSSVYTLSLCMLLMVCGLLAPLRVSAQAPIRVINAAGGNAVGQGLRIEFYANGSYSVYRDGKRETFDGSDQMSWQSAPSNIRGVQDYLGITYNEAPPPGGSNANLHLLAPSYVSPVSGLGTSGSPFKVQLMGNVTDNNYANGTITLSYVINITYVTGNYYFNTDYMIYFTGGNLTEINAALYHTERVSMGAALADLTAVENGRCAIGYASAEVDGSSNPTPKVVGVYRNSSCGATAAPTPRSHVYKMDAGFHSYFAAAEESRMTLPDGYVDITLQNQQESTQGTGGNTKGISAELYWDFIAIKYLQGTGDAPLHPSVSSRMLTGYGSTQNDYDAVSSGTATTTAGSFPFKVGFLQPKVKVTEGNTTAQYTQNMVYITGASGKLTGDLTVALDTMALSLVPGDSSLGASTSDYSYVPGVLIKAFAKMSSSGTDTIKVPLDSFFIKGNAALEFNRSLKLKLTSYHGLFTVDAGHDTCRVVIVDDEPRDLTFTPAAATIDEGASQSIRVSLPTGVTAGGNVIVSLKDTAYANTSGFTVPTTVTIPSGGNYVDFNVTTVLDNILERDDTIHISAAGTIVGQQGSSSSDAVIILKDKTRQNANNTKITFTPALSSVTKGTTGTVITASLPSGITTAIPIDITLSAGSGATADPSSYGMPAHLYIDSSKSSGTIAFDTRVDSIVYGPLVKTALIAGNAVDKASNTFTMVNQANVNINDSNWPLAHPVVFSNTATPINEGSSTSLKLTLADGLVAGRDFGFWIGETSDLTSGLHTLTGMPTDSVRISTGSSSVNVATMGTSTDNVIGNTETLTFSGTSTTEAAASIGTTAVTITDNTLTTPPLHLTLTASSPLLDEGQKTSVTAKLDGTYVLSQPLTITFSVTDGNTSSGDRSIVTSTLTLPAGSNSATQTDVVLANTDQIIEGKENFQIGATLSDATIAVVKTTVNINDQTRLNAGSTTLTVSGVPATWTKGDSRTVTVSLPSGISTQIPITLNFTRDVALSTGTAGYTIPSSISIPAGSTSTSFTLTLPTDNVLYGPMKFHLVLAGSAADTSSPTGAYSYSNGVAFDIQDNNYPLAHALIVSGGNTTEGDATGFTNTITLPDGLVAGRDLGFFISNTNSLTLGTHGTTSRSDSAHILTGASSGTIQEIKAANDYYVGNAEDVVFTAANADFTSASATVHILDNTSAALNLTLTPSVTALNEGSEADVTIGLDNNLLLLHDLTVSLAVVNGTTTVADYTLAQTTVTLPAGTNSKTIASVIKAKTDNVIEATESFKITGTVTTGQSVTAPDMNFTIKDLTHLDATKTAITVTTSASTYTKGDVGTLTISLPSGVTTQTTISVALSLDASSVVKTGGYTLTSPIALYSGNTRTVAFSIPTDKILYGPEVHALKLDGSTTDGVGSTYTTNNISVDVVDNNYPLANSVIISTGTVAEGSSTGITNTITLPDNLVAGRDLNFWISNSNSLTLGTHGITSPTDSITIATGSKSANIELIKPANDYYVGNDEDVTFSGAKPGFPVSDGITHITDATSGSLGLTLTPTTSALDEGNSTDVTVSINNSLILVNDLTISLTAVDGTTTSGDYTLQQSTLTLPAGQNSVVVSNVIKANTDKILEGTQSFKLTGAITSGQSATVPDMNFTINDLTHLNAAYTAITVTPSPAGTSWTKGQSGTLKVALPAGVTTETPISVALDLDATSVVTAGGYTLTSPITFTTNGDTSVAFSIPTDKILYGPEVHALKLDGATTDAIGSTYTTGNLALDIVDNNYPLANPVIISAGTVAEGSSTGVTNTITLPDNLVAGRDLNFWISNTNSLTLGTHGITSPTDSVTIATGNKSADIELIKPASDYYVGNDEDVTFAGAKPGFTVTSGITHITDATTGSLGLTLTPTTSALDEGNSTDVTVAINNSLILLQDLTISLTAVDGTATSGDYTLQQTTLTLPAGQNSTTISDVITANTDMILEGTQSFKLTGVITSTQTATVPDMNFTINDLTHLNAAYTAITVTPSPAGTSWTKGQSGTLKVALPAGVTTETPISVALSLDATSVVTAGGYTLTSPITFTTNGDTSVAFSIPTDKILYGPEVHALKLDGATTDAIGSTYTTGNLALDIVDNNYPLANPVIISAGTVAEGSSTGVTNTITLPDNLVAGRDLNFWISNTNSLTLGTHGITSPTDSVTIATGNKSADIELIKPASDYYVGNDEDVTFAGAKPGFTVTSGITHITDATSSTLGLTLTPTTSALDEGSSTDVTVAINNSLILLQPLTITLTPANISTSSSDYTLQQATLTLPAGQNSTTISNVITANSDLILEATESFKLTGTVTAGPVVTVPNMLFTVNDLTHTDPANTVITFTPSAPSPWTKGDSKKLDVSLPTGVTTEVPIVITTAVDAASVVKAGGYTLPSVITLGSGNDTLVSFLIPTDNYVYGPAAHHLTLDGSASDPIGSAYTLNNIDLDIRDNNYPLATGLTLAVAASSITEGGAATTVTLSLPGTLKAGRDLAFAIGTSSSLTLGQHTISWPTDSVHFVYGDHSIIIAIPLALADKVLGNDEDITITGASDDFTVNGSSLHIKDVTADDPLNGVITLSFVTGGPDVLEGNSATIKASLAAGVTAVKPVSIDLSAAAASTASASDYSGLSNVTIAAGSTSNTFTLNATTDYILEPTELLRITGSSATFPGLTVQDLDVNIDDATHLDPANLVLQILVDSSNVHEGNNTKVHVGFVNTNVTSSTAFDVALVADASSTADASDYSGLATPLTIPANTNNTVFTLQATDDNVLEGPETLKIDGTATGFTVNNSGVLNILEKYPLAVYFTKANDGAEPATNGNYTLKLPGTATATADVIVDLTMANTGDTHNFTLPVTHWIIPAGTNSVSVPVVVIDDYLIQGDGSMTGALQVASMVANSVPYNFTVDNSNVSLTIHDDESDATGPKAEARKLVVEKIEDARKITKNGSFRVRFSDPRLSAVKDVQVTYGVTGDAIPGKDYEELPGMITIPAYDTEAVQLVVPIMNTEVYHDVIATITLDQVSSSMSSINWKLADDASADVKIRDDNGVPDSVLQYIGPNKWTDDTTRKIRVHPALSPNGDGKGNDLMYIENINKFPSNEVTVFNRWGATVFHTMNYSNTSNFFSGRYNSNGSGDVPEGTYYYIIYIDDKGKRERYTGFVVIRR